MAGPEDRHEDEPEDLFEDLDKFFAPIQDPDWPEVEEGSAEDEAGAPPAPEVSDGEDVLGGWAGPEIAIPDAEELIGAGPVDEAAPFVPGPPDPATPPPTATGPLTFDEPGDAEPSAPGAPADDEAWAAEAPAAGTPAAEEEWVFEQPGGDAGGDEWERFRETVQAAGPAEDIPTPPAAPEPPPDVAFDTGTAPPQYAGLPGPDEEEAVSLEEAVFGERPPEEPALPPTIEEPVSEEPLVGAGAGDAGDVEAAAEHFAEGIRSSPQDVERELLADLDEPGAQPTGTVRIEPVVTDVEPDAPIAWEEGGGADEPAAPGRNVPAAVISGVLLAVAAVALLAIGKGPFAFLAGAVILLAQAELYAVMRRRGAHPATALGLVIGLFMVIGAYLRGEQALLFGAALGMMLCVLWYMAAPAKGRKGTVANVGATMLGILYVPFLASFAMILLRAPDNSGRNLLLIVIGLTVLYDVSAYGIGTWWGSRPLAPTISPKKSWEGAVGATFMLLLAALTLVPLFVPLKDMPGPAVGLALIIAVAAPIGDLVESALKRDFGIKDMGSLLPGHGGVLDRIDSILFAAPAAWYFLRIVLL